MMSSIEEHLINTVAADLAARGVDGAAVTVVSAAAEDWCFRIVVGERQFAIGFNHRELLRVAETTPGAVKHFASNDAAPICTSSAARQRAIELVSAAVATPAFALRDPPVI